MMQGSRSITSEQSQLTIASGAVKPPGKRKSRVLRPRRFKVMTAFLLLFLWLAGVMLYQTHKPLPPGLSAESPLYKVSSVDFWHDLTYQDAGGAAVREEQILPRILQIVEDSREFLVIDLFLFNDYTHVDQQFPPVSRKLADKLIAQKSAYPGMEIAFITDEVNTNYGSAPNQLLEDMKAAGIRVVMTDVDDLRDSTPAYSAVWRTFIQWFGQSGRGWIPNLMASGGPDITARSYLKLLNVKANHRKVVLSESTALISSGNVHDASAYHSNIALEVQGPILADILQSEQAAADLSGAGPLLSKPPQFRQEVNSSPEAALEVRYLTEGKVYTSALESLGAAGRGDIIWMGMFYLADDRIIDALLAADKRGAEVRLLLDPNQNAFGRDKIGIPNRPVAMDLNRRSNGRIAIRWYNTGQEQYHSKLMFIAKASGNSIVLGGSTNFTARNLDDYNLENNLFVSVPRDQPLYTEVESYFTRLWNNEDARYSLPLEDYQSEITWLKYIIYRLQTRLGFTTF
ncbi:phospholipase D family protein [Paenibacillus sp. MMS20-IR301]|uniref:phospholipase D family protein n=1 Tax=Paenibacillus sp. MMS20-IR301 TaxID=2895946 RepID=UPI0028EA18A1|nr:phospholipase D family protein [Paenibacillus sp. MMS20-IR301]WNS42601.1 phospholipase D family protein [Paenibacillus sp. MMS20-IR301]